MDEDADLDLVDDHQEGATLLDRRRTAAEHRVRRNLDRDLPELDDDGEPVEVDD